MWEVLRRNMNGARHTSGEAEVRRGTGFVGIVELPSDDDEEAAQQHKVQRRLQARTSVASCCLEDNEPAGHRVAFDPGTQDRRAACNVFAGCIKKVKTGRQTWPHDPAGRQRWACGAGLCQCEPAVVLRTQNSE